jgi:hypothetical protein
MNTKQWITLIKINTTAKKKFLKSQSSNLAPKQSWKSKFHLQTKWFTEIESTAKMIQWSWILAPKEST